MCSSPCLMVTSKSDTYIYGKYIYAIYLWNVRKLALQDTIINNEMSHPFVLLSCLQVYVKIWELSSCYMGYFW